MKATPTLTPADIRREAIALGWRCPLFLPAIARIRFSVDERVPTACAELPRIIRINPTYWAQLSPQERAFVIAHEILHFLSRHWARRDQRDFRRWNVACDRAINQVLKDVGLTAPKGLCWPEKGHEEDCAEEHYARDQQSNGSNGGGQNNGGPPQPGEYGGQPSPGCGDGVLPGGGEGGNTEPDDEEGEGEGEGGGGSGNGNGKGKGERKSPERKSPDRRWAEIAAQCRSQARGVGAGKSLARLTLIPPARVDWRAVLRRAISQAIAEAGTDDVSWSRRSRRKMPGVASLPGGICTRARVAVILDTSGSMWTDEVLSRLVSEAAAIVRQAKIGGWLVVHDHIVQWSGRLDAADPSKIRDRIKGGGGTTFGSAYDEVARQRGRFGAAVHLTDGYGEHPWPKKPNNCRQLIVGLVGTRRASISPPTGARAVEIVV